MNMVSNHNTDPSDKIAGLVYHMQSTYAQYVLQTWLAQTLDILVLSLHLHSVFITGSKDEAISVGINVLMLCMQTSYARLMVSTQKLREIKKIW